jgi:hypothetical protein
MPPVSRTKVGLDGADAVADVVDPVGDEGGVPVDDRAFEDLAGNDQDDDALVEQGKRLRGRSRGGAPRGASGRSGTAREIAC